MRVVMSCILFCVLGASSASAQGNTNDFRRSGPEAERRAYFAQVRTEVHELLIEWQFAWEADKAAEVAKLYTDGASYFPPGTGPIQTRNSIRDFFTSFLQTVGNVHVQLTDFGTSGDLAYATTRVSYFVQTEQGNSRQLVRTDLFVLRRHSGRGWQIEMQLAREEKEGQPLP